MLCVYICCAVHLFVTKHSIQQQLAAQMIMEAVPESDEPDDNDDTSQPPSDSDRSKLHQSIQHYKK
jgi:hypothetical protein